MSETFLRPKVSSTKVTDWVAPAFDDFEANTAITTITASSLTFSNSSHRRKYLPSTLESNRLSARKRGRLSLEQTHGLETSRERLSDNEPWVDKYKPETQHELAVHKKKIEEVETWLKAQVLEVKPKQDFGCREEKNQGVVLSDQAFCQKLHTQPQLMSARTLTWVHAYEANIFLMEPYLQLLQSNFFFEDLFIYYV